MADITLTTPKTLDDREMTGIDVVNAHFDFEGKVLIVHYDEIAEDGTKLRRQREVADGSAVQTYLANQKGAICTRLLAKLGLQGTVG